jgi:AraC-like DNA-binding protein
VTQTVSLDAETLESLRSHGIKATRKEGQNYGLIETTSFVGATINAAKVKTRGLSTWQSRQPEGSIALSVAVSGSYGGLVNGRAYASKNDKISFVSLPGEEQKSLIQSEETTGWLININNKQLCQEWKNQLQDDSKISLATDAFAGHEAFLVDTSSHLIWLKRSKPSQWHQQAMDSTQTAILSFVATRMHEFIGAEVPQIGNRTLASYVDGAMSFMETAYLRPLSLGDVCEACHVSARTLQIGFRELRGETPMQALRRIRLEKMRSLLLQGINVTLASTKVGLSPTGRTAALYAEAFGEKPSQTSERTFGQGLP